MRVFLSAAVLLLFPAFVMGQEPSSEIKLQPIKVTGAQNESMAQRSADTQAVFERLDSAKVQIEFVDTPLYEAIAAFMEQVDARYTIDQRALNDIGLDIDTPVTLSLRNVTARSTLRLMLRQLDLTFFVEDDRVIITTPEEAESELITKYYYVKDLVLPKYHDDTHPLGVQTDFDELINLLTSIVRPESWEELGGPSSITHYGYGITVRQTQETHEAIEGTLAALRKARSLPSDKYRVDAISISHHAEEALAMERKLESTRVSFTLVDTPLDEFVSALSNKIETPIFINARALEDAGLSVDVPISFEWNNLRAVNCLQDLNRHLALGWYAQGEYLVISTPEEIETDLDTRVYPVRDLIRQGLEYDAGKLVYLRDTFGVAGGFGSWSSNDERCSYISAVDQRKPENFWHDLLFIKPTANVMDFESLMESISANIEPDSWEALGGPGSMAFDSGSESLAVSTTPEVHDKLAKWLHQVRAETAPISAEEFRAYVDKMNAEVLTLTYFAPGCKDSPRMSSDALRDISGKTQSSIAPESWTPKDQFIQPVQTGLIIRTRRDIHREVANFLVPMNISAKRQPSYVGGGLNGSTSGSSNTKQSSSKNQNQGGFISDGTADEGGGFFSVAE